MTAVRPKLSDNAWLGSDSLEYSKNQNVSEALTEILIDLGVRHAFGITGGSIAPLCDALGKSAINFAHFRHETGAAFAAAEAYFATGNPSLVFVTSGPGITNALTGVSAARWEGAKVLLISAATSAPLRGRWAAQETSGYTMPVSGIFTAGPIFNYATVMEHPSEIQQIASRLANGLSRVGGFAAHISIPTALQGIEVPELKYNRLHSIPPTCSPEAVEAYSRLLKDRPFVIWVGFGARDAANEIRELVARSDAHVMTTPRGKGIFPERHSRFLGVTGLGGYGQIEEHLKINRPDYILVLGTRLGESSSYWQQELVPQKAFIHIDIDPEVPGASYPDIETHAVQADVKGFVKSLLQHWPETPPTISSKTNADASGFHPVEPATARSADSTLVRPAVLMDAIQRMIVDQSDAVVMAESGNAFAWGNQCLRFDAPKRYRVSVSYGSMGHVAAGVVGAALASRGKAVAIVGDGSMLMNNEISTAVQHGVGAVWIVMNDGCYGMVEHGMQALGFTPRDTTIPLVDFVQVARGIGADGLQVDDETKLDEALITAMRAKGPFVVDVRIDPSLPGPWIKRIHGLITQGAKAKSGEVVGAKR